MSDRLNDPDPMHDIRAGFGVDVDGLYIKRDQYIPDDHLAGLREERDFNATHRAGEMHKVASIPVALVELWARQGFDIHRESAKAIIKRLRAENLDVFVTSGKLGV